MKNSLTLEGRIHTIFTVSIFFKGVYAFFEVIAGFLILLTSKAHIIIFVAFLTRQEVTEDSSVGIAHSLLSIAQDLSISGKHFIAGYLLSHGLVKLVLITGLIKKRRWAYYSTFIIFPLFIGIEIKRFVSTQSFWLILATILDTMIIVLALCEYHFATKNRKIT